MYGIFAAKKNVTNLKRFSVCGNNNICIFCAYCAVLKQSAFYVRNFSKIFFTPTISSKRCSPLLFSCHSWTDSAKQQRLGLKKSGRGPKVAISRQALQISDREDNYGRSDFNFASKLSL